MVQVPMMYLILHYYVSLHLDLKASYMSVMSQKTVRGTAFK